MVGGLVALALAMTLLGPADAQAVPAQETPTDHTLLPPAEGDDVQIAPTDQHRDSPSATSKGGVHRTDGSSRRSVPDGTAAGVALILVALVTTGMASARLVRMLYAWRSPVALAAAGFGPARAPATSFSLLVPARGAARRLGETLDQLALLDHPLVEVLAIVPYDDAAARHAARAAAARHPDVVHIVVDKSFRQRRAAGLNAALAEAGGEVVGVVEPGDRVHPRLLRHVDSCFADPEVAAVQGGVQRTLDRPRWFGARSVVERYFWSRSHLHLHATQHFTPLDDSTAFVRTGVLRASGGWDETCPAEGCELGIRLSLQGRSIVVAYSPDLATQKPAVASVPALLAERTRWIGGFARVLRRRRWRQLPTRSQRLRAAVALSRPIVDAVAGLAVAGAAIAAVVLPLRPLYELLLLLPLVPTLVSLAVELVALGELRRVHDRPRRRRDQFWLLLSFLPYQVLSAVAAGRVLIGELLPRRHGGPMPVAPPRPSRSRRRHDERLRHLDAEETIDLTRPHVVDLAGGINHTHGAARRPERLPERERPAVPALPAAGGER